MKDVTNRLLPDRTKSDEFEVLMSSRGGESRQSKRTVIHEDGRLVVHYAKNHQISAIWVDDDYGESALHELEGQVREAVSQDGTEIARQYLHSMYITDSFYRYGDDFQILPAPPDAPHPTFLHAPHPFLLEYRFETSPNSIVSQHRSMRRFSELCFVLNALLHTLTLPRNTGAHEWVVIAGPEWESKYLQVGYWGGKQYRPKSADGFSTVEGLKPLERVDAKSYYTQIGVISGNRLQLPDSLEESLAAYDRLDSDAKARFCRASYWSQVSYQVFTISQSASFAALVSAIEVFLPNPEIRCKKCGRPTSKDCCTQCKQPLSGPTKAFRDFVEVYVPASRRLTETSYTTAGQASATVPVLSPATWQRLVSDSRLN